MDLIIDTKILNMSFLNPPPLARPVVGEGGREGGQLKHL